MAIINGTSGDDTDLTGTNSDDQIFGFDGADDLIGLDGNDELRAGDGDGDDITGGAGNDIIDGGAGGNDEVRYQDEGGGGAIRVDLELGLALDTYGDIDTLIGIEKVSGNNGDDVILGDALRNDLVGKAGNDWLDGRGGDDEFEAGAGNDVIIGGDGIDLVKYIGEDGTLGVSVNLSDGVATDTFGDTDRIFGVENVRGTDRADTLTGDGVANRIEGEGGADTIDGGAGNDELIGGNGNDTLIAGTGEDLLTGGAGGDEFIFALGDGSNTITDFESQIDQIVLIGLPSGTTVTDLLPFVSQDGDDVLFDGGGTSIRLENIQLSALDPADIEFI